MTTNQWTYRKKPVEIEAVRVSDIARHAHAEWDVLPPWVQVKWRDGSLTIQAAQVLVSTLEGQMIGGADDWIIRGVKGEIYPCKPDIFAATYDKI